MKTAFFTLLAVACFAWHGAQASNTRPSSGRRLSYGHWLSCWGGEDEVLRTDPPFNKDTPEEDIAAAIPKFDGQYSFDVRDTWEQQVTRSGSSCVHCGQTCRGKDSNRTCSCNSCSWTETETRYRPWSTQTVTWHAEWVRDPGYAQKRADWIAKGKPALARSTSDLSKLIEFDPERPVDYFLFPGEVEHLHFGNSGGILSSSQEITPSVWVSDARYAYDKRIEIHSDIGLRAQCDDRDFRIDARIHAGPRISGPTPNSIEFRDNWLQGAKDDTGNVTNEAAKFVLTDVSAMRYEGQNIFDHYKSARVSISLWQADRWLWGVDTRIGRNFSIENNLSVIQWHDNDAGLVKGKVPPPATYDLMSGELLQSRWTGSSFHLKPGQTYEVCTYVQRNNNIYYKTSTWYGRDIWSDAKCALFKYEGEDLRSTGRAVRDGLSRIFGFGLF